MAARRRKGAGAPSSTNAVDIAIDAVANDRAPDDDARRLLRKQERLIEAQLIGERLSNGLKILTACVGLAMAIGLGVMVWQAQRYQGLVVEPFSVPPELSARGVTGEVVASRVLDRLSVLEASTFSIRAQGSYERSWGKEIEVEIPETGVSLGELQRQLRTMFGRETRVAGEIVRKDGGLSIAARTDGGFADRYEGPEADLEALIDRAAEGIYRRTQPYRYGVYLRSQNRFAEAREVMWAETGRGSATDRAWANVGLAAVAGMTEGPEAGLIYLERAQRLAPGLYLPAFNRAQTLRAIGREEEALAAYKAGRLALNNQKRAEISLDRRALQIREHDAIQAAMLGDYALGERTWRRAMDEGRRSTGSDNRARLAFAYAALHQPTDALATLRAPDPTQGFIGAATVLDKWIAEARAYEERGDWAAIIAIRPALDQMLATYPGVRSGSLATAQPYLVVALAKTGDFAGARALSSATPLDCAPCVIARAKVEAVAANHAHADHWFGEAARMSPSLPMAKLEWGRALLERGDLAGASERLMEAHKLGPNFADPLHYWGESLLRQGKFEAAIERLVDADKQAPKWGRNHLLWGDALAKLGRNEEARTHWRRASALDLTAAERALVQARLRGDQ